MAVDALLALDSDLHVLARHVQVMKVVRNIGGFSYWMIFRACASSANDLDSITIQTYAILTIQQCACLPTQQDTQTRSRPSSPSTVEVPMLCI